MVNFTTNDMLLYINNELSLTQKAIFEQALLDDSMLQEQYVQLTGNSYVPNTTTQFISPSQRTVDSILAYARATVAEPQEQ